MALQPTPAIRITAGDPAADAPRRRLGRRDWAALAAFALVAGGGTYYAKWHPYWLKGFKVAGDHTLGGSIVSGRSAAAPSGWHAALSFAAAYAKAIWVALAVGLLIAAAVEELVPRDLLHRAVRGRPRSAAVRGMSLALPSMMCTCCSAPPTVALARSRAPLATTLGYWLGNPVLNPATLVFATLVLGWKWAVLRLAIGAVLVFGVAAGAQRVFGVAAAAPAGMAPIPVTTGGGLDGSFPRRYLATLGRLAAGLVPEYAVAVLALGAARAWLFPAMSPATGHAAWLVAVLAVTGTLFVVPTAGEIPIIATLAVFGLGPAAAGALLIALPAVSLPSLLMVGRAVPVRALAFTVGAVVVAAGAAAAVAAAAGLVP